MIEIALTALVSIVITGSGAYLALGRKATSRDEVVELIRAQSLARGDAGAVCETHCPYNADKRMIGDTLARINASLDELRELMRSTREDLVGLKAIVRRPA